MLKELNEKAIAIALNTIATSPDFQGLAVLKERDEDGVDEWMFYYAPKGTPTGAPVGGFFLDAESQALTSCFLGGRKDLYLSTFNVLRQAQAIASQELSFRPLSETAPGKVAA